MTDQPASAARPTIAQKRARFRALHEAGCFVLPNPWDLGSAKLMQHLGFEAIASTSAGFAWAQGRPDNRVTRADVLEHLASLAAATDLPVNADFEGGFAVEPEGVAESVALAIGTGIAGLSIEDLDERTPGTYYPLPLAVERIRAARAAIDASGADVLLVARTEAPLAEPAQLSAALDKLAAFAEAGADCLYAPYAKSPAEITAIIRAVQPKPVNVLMGGPGLPVAALADLGVRRISTGGALARVAWGALKAAAEGIRGGSFDGLAGGMPGKEINGLLAG